MRKCQFFSWCLEMVVTAEMKHTETETFPAFCCKIGYKQVAYCHHQLVIMTVQCLTPHVTHE